MRNWWKPLLLCLLAAKPWMSASSQTIHLSDTDVTYPGEAAEEVRTVLFGQAVVYRPNGTKVNIGAPVSTTAYWFDFGVGEGSVIQRDDGVSTNSLGPSSMVFTNRSNVYRVPIVNLVETGSSDTDVRFYPDGYYSDSAVVVSNRSVEITRSSTSVTLVGENEGIKRKRIVHSDVFTPAYAMEDLSARSFRTNSVLYAMREEAKEYISGKSPSGTDRDMFSIMDDAATNYVRNAGFYLSGVDLSAICVWNSTGDGSLVAARGLPSGRFRCATAITRRHLVSSKHYHMMQTWTGSNRDFEVRFVSADNRVAVRHAVAVASTPPLDNGSIVYDSDTVVIRLDDDLPEWIVPMKLLGGDAHEYMPTYTTSIGLGLLPDYPMYVANADRQVRIGVSVSNNSWYYMDLLLNTWNGADWGFDLYGLYMQDDYPGWYWTPSVAGDSSTPFFMVLHGEPILCGTHTTPLAGWGNLLKQSADIQQIINAWGDTNTLSFVDFSGYETYPENINLTNH